MFVGVSQLQFAGFFPHNYTAVIGLGKEEHRGPGAFSSSPIKGSYCLLDLSTVGVDPGHLAEAVTLGFLFSMLCCWGESHCVQLTVKK